MGLIHDFFFTHVQFTLVCKMGIIFDDLFAGITRFDPTAFTRHFATAVFAHKLQLTTGTLSEPVLRDNFFHLFAHFVFTYDTPSLSRVWIITVHANINPAFPTKKLVTSGFEVAYIVNIFLILLASGARVHFTVPPIDGLFQQ